MYTESFNLFASPYICMRACTCVSMTVFRLNAHTL